MSNRALQFGGLALAGGVGYYFYQAGGDPKVAQKKAEADAAKVSREVRDHVPGGSHLPGAGKEAKKDAELGASQVGSTLSQLGKDAKSEASKAEAKLEQMRSDAAKSLDRNTKDIKANTNAAIDKFDTEVTKGASQAKSTVSSWFGGSK